MTGNNNAITDYMKSLRLSHNVTLLNIEVDNAKSATSSLFVQQSEGEQQVESSSDLGDHHNAPCQLSPTRLAPPPPTVVQVHQEKQTPRTAHKAARWAGCTMKKRETKRSSSFNHRNLSKTYYSKPQASEDFRPLRLDCQASIFFNSNQKKACHKRLCQPPQRQDSFPDLILDSDDDDFDIISDEERSTSIDRHDDRRHRNIHNIIDDAIRLVSY